MKFNLFFDVSNLVRRAYYVIEKTTEGFVIEKYKGVVILTFIDDIKHLIDKIGVENVLNTYYCFDNTSFRYLLREDYKGNRTGKQNIDIIFSELFEVLKRRGQNVINILGLEADDIIALLVEKFSNDKNIIVSADGDLQQLVTERTCVLIPHRQTRKLIQIESNNSIRLDDIPNEVVDPKFTLIEKVLKGCKGDNIQGIAPKGFRTAKIKEIANLIDLDNLIKLTEILEKYNIFVTENQLLEQLKMVCLRSEYIPDILVKELKNYPLKKNKELF